MAERVTILHLDVEWEPNAPEAVLLSGDHGATVLSLNAHRDDEDQRCVVLQWTGTSSACFSGPNDEAISGHRLYGKGLKDVSWAGQVLDSKLVRGLERQNRVHPHHDAARFAQLAHHVVLLKEGVVEVVARSLAVRRFDGSTLEAASTAMRGH